MVKIESFGSRGDFVIGCGEDEIIPVVGIKTTKNGLLYSISNLPHLKPMMPQRMVEHAGDLGRKRGYFFYAVKCPGLSKKEGYLATLDKAYCHTQHISLWGYKKNAPKLYCELTLKLTHPSLAISIAKDRKRDVWVLCSYIYKEGCPHTFECFVFHKDSKRNKIKMTDKFFG